MSNFLKSAFQIVLVFIFIAVYWNGAVKQLSRVNTDMKKTDQEAYMNYARKLYESDYQYKGGRNRMPVYPFVQSLFYHPAMSDEFFFTQGKYINLILSLVILAGLTLIFQKFFDKLLTINLTLIIGFTVFMFKAPFFQAEILFYFLNSCLFLLMWLFLERPSWIIAILIGIVAGFAHLTKASILPGFLIFLVILVIKSIWIYFQKRKTNSPKVTFNYLTSNILVIPLIGMFFLATVFPYILTSKRVYGNYFYNVNSTFYMWYDSWKEAKQGTRAHGDRKGWPDMPSEDIPSMAKYLNEHSAQQTLNRFVKGGRAVFGNVVNSYGYFKYFIVFMIALIVSIINQRKLALTIFASRPMLIFFLASYFTAYLLLYAWYGLIVHENRLILAQFILIMFTISMGLQSLLRSSRIRIGEHSFHTLTIFNIGVFIFLIFDISLVLTMRVETMFGGN